MVKLFTLHRNSDHVGAILIERNLLATTIREVFSINRSGQPHFFRQHSRGKNFDALNRPAPEFPKIPFIAREQMGRMAGNGSAENRHVFQLYFSKR